VQCIEGQALVATLSATDTVILVNLDDLPAGTIGDLAELALLIGPGGAKPK
jgi:hypothetical protein